MEEDNKNICKLCDKACSVAAERIYCQGPCQRDFHTKCIGFTPVSLNFYRQCSNLMYECDDCQDNPYRAINATLKKVLSFMCIFNERLNRQENNCDLIFKHFETLNHNLQKFENERKVESDKEAVAVQHKTSSKSQDKSVKQMVSDAVVLVKPKTIQKCSTTRAVLDEKNIPDRIAVESVNNLPNGGLKIKCKSKNDVVKVYKKAINVLGENYSITIPNKRFPKIRVTNMSKKLEGEEIIESIKNRNELMKEAKVKVVHVFEVKFNETYEAIVEVDPKTFDVLMKEKTIAIGTDICDVTESLTVLRCYKCCGYNHKSNTCKNKKACLRCGGEHVVKECKATKNECINCKVAAEKFNIEINCSHPAWSKSCTVLQRNVEKGRQRIDYAE